jgi:hypothetical protein
MAEKLLAKISNSRPRDLRSGKNLWVGYKSLEVQWIDRCGFVLIGAVKRLLLNQRYHVTELDYGIPQSV